MSCSETTSVPNADGTVTLVKKSISVGYEPPLIPIKFSYDGNSLSTSFSGQVTTFFGTFSLTGSRSTFDKPARPFTTDTRPLTTLQKRKYDFDDIDVRQHKDVATALVKGNDLVVALIYSEEEVDVFSVSNSVRLKIYLAGGYPELDFQGSKYVEVDLRNEVTVAKIVMYIDSTLQKESNDFGLIPRMDIMKRKYRYEEQVLEKALPLLTSVDSSLLHYSLGEIDSTLVSGKVFNDHTPPH